MPVSLRSRRSPPDGWAERDGRSAHRRAIRSAPTRCTADDFADPELRFGEDEVTARSGVAGASSRAILIRIRKLGSSVLEDASCGLRPARPLSLLPPEPRGSLAIRPRSGCELRMRLPPPHAGQASSERLARVGFRVPCSPEFSRSAGSLRHAFLARDQPTLPRRRRAARLVAREATGRRPGPREPTSLGRARGDGRPMVRWLAG
jgi:hypothetical protein